MFAIREHPSSFARLSSVSTCPYGSINCNLRFYGGYYRSFRHTVTQHVAQNEQRVDENVTGDRDVDRSGVVQLESRFVEDSLERIHRIDRQTDREDRHYLKYMFDTSSIESG